MLDLPSTRNINSEPVILAGLTASELLIVTLIGIASAIVASAVMLLLFPSVGLKLMGFMFLLAVVVAFYGRYWIVQNKRNRPEGYYLQALKIQFDALTGGDRVIEYEGFWDFLRHGGTRNG